MFVLRPAIRNTVPTAVFDGSIPTSSDLREIARNGYGFHFVNVPEEFRNFEFLQPYADEVRQLGIADATCTNVASVSRLPNLEFLSLYVNQKSDVDLTGLSKLEDFHGPHRHFESVAECHSLRRLALQQTKVAALGEIRGPLEYLELIDARLLLEPPRLRHPELLQIMWLLGPREISLSGIAGFSDLRHLSLESCSRITGVDALLALAHITMLGFSKCDSIEPLESLLELDGVEIGVAGRSPFDPAFKKAALKSGSSWNFYRP